MTSPQMNFAGRLVYLKKKRIDFSGRPYLPAIYNSTARNLVLRQPTGREEYIFGSRDTLPGGYLSRHPAAVRLPAAGTGSVVRAHSVDINPGRQPNTASNSDER